MSEVNNPVLGYADSYRREAKRGQKVADIWSVIADLERNIAPLFTAAQSELAALREELADRKTRLEAANWNKRHSDQDHATELRKVREELARKDKVIQAFHDGYGYQHMQQLLADSERLNSEIRQELSGADEEKMALRRRVIEATAWISDYRRSLDSQRFQDNDEGDRQSRMHSRLCRSLDLFLGLKPTESGASE